MNKITIAAAAAMLLSSAVAAHAESFGKACTTAPESQWLTIDELKAKVEGQGYTVKKAKFKGTCGEVYALDKDGGRVELFVDPTDGKIVGQL